MNRVRRLVSAVFNRSTAPTISRPAAAIIKRTDGIDYIDDLLELVDLPLARMADVPSITGPCFYIRHDVDSDLNMAHHVAEVEARHGFHATYFLLTPGSYRSNCNYYGRLENGRIVHQPDLADRCHAIIELGHDIGFHNDLIPLSLRTGRPPGDILAEEVAYFASHGIPLRGMAAHGNPLCRQLQFNNRELFQGCIRNGWEPGRTIEFDGRRINLHSLDMTDFGFEYEAYSLPRDSRISESGGHWGGRIAGERLPKERWSQSFDRDEFRRAIAGASVANSVQAFSIMTHPCHWRVA